MAIRYDGFQDFCIYSKYSQIFNSDTYKDSENNES